jgi:epoxyqueuosine reductase
MTQIPLLDLDNLAENIKTWGRALGFQQVGITDIDLSQHEKFLQDWLDKGYHGEMDYMKTRGMMRARPEELLPGTLRCISVRMDYLPPNAQFARTLKDKNKAYISRYALGRDYHKVVRNRLKKLGQQISEHVEQFQGRPFVDSAPILEHAVAEKAGLGWTGKHSLTLNAEAGSWFFLGELLINLPLPVDKPVTEQCGNCVACMTICPTQAIVEPYVVDARRCISYLTIELDGPIPEEFRPLIGNRVYGCDDCQLICPWNKFAQTTQETDFHPRSQLGHQELLTLLSWDETTFLKNTEGSAIRRIGFEKWQRNIAVGLGNAPYSSAIVTALETKLTATGELTPTEVVKEHILWAITQQTQKQHENKVTQNERQTLRLIRSVEKGMPRDA